jgi:hypothetical protein
MLHELVPIMVINIQSHIKKSMIITEYFKRQITNKKTYPDTINLNTDIYLMGGVCSLLYEILYFAVFFVVSWTFIPHLSIFHLTKA